MTFCEKIVKLRKIKGLTQDEFASAVGVSRQAVYKWESGQSYPEVSKLLEIKMLFGISIDDLLDENYEVVMPEKKKKKRISKSLAKKIEEEVRKEESVVIENTPALVSESVEEKEDYSVKDESVVIEAPAPVSEEKEEKSEEIKEEKAARRGFFSRLFGRK